MKKLALLITILICSSSLCLSAQEKKETAKPDPMGITYEQFESWMKTLKPLGFPFTETGKNGPEWMATFVQGTKMIGITLAPLSSFEDYKKMKNVTTYEFKGHRAAFYGTQNFWNLSVELKALNACFQITTVYTDAKQADLEKTLIDSGALDKTTNK